MESLIRCGLKCLDGIDRIVVTRVPLDMGDSGRKATRLKETFICGRFGRFKWANKDTGNIIYSEITREDYYTIEDNLNKF